MDLDPWIETIVQNINDSLTWDAVADWNEENGHEAFAAALRLPWVRSRCPLRRRSYRLMGPTVSYDWEKSYTWERNSKFLSDHYLPAELLYGLKPPRKQGLHWAHADVHYREYPTKVEAFRAFLHALCVLSAKGRTLK